MAKIIKITREHIEEVRQEFEKSLLNMKLSDGKISFTRSFNSVKREAVLYFSQPAWLKMQGLIKESGKEIGWHGIARRGDDPEKDEYYIDDILVYPQEVTGATVTTDQVAYQDWLMSHDDEVFNNIRMQGHSHVYMATSPSGVDESLYERILDQLEDDMFYIFLIWNKRNEKTIRIYDLAKNVMFETADVTVTVLENREDDLYAKTLSEDERKMLWDCLLEYRKKKLTDSFIEENKDKVKDKAYAATPNTKPDNGSGYNYGNYYGGYGNESAGKNSAPQTEQKQKKEEKKTENGKSSPTKTRKGRRSNKQYGNVKQFHTGFSPMDDDDEYSPYGWSYD